MISTDLGGHSGCKILLCETDNGEAFVRKISSGKNYNSRLELQAEKQRCFQGTGIKAPKVFNEGYTGEDLFYFDMEYISGMTLAEYIKCAEIGKIREIVNNLVDSRSITPQDKPAGNTQEIFGAKISSLKKTLSARNNGIIDSAISLLENHDWSAFPQTACHGDMTLENIIIKNDRIYLIDFLDSFYDSWLLDMSTLMQDVWAMWSYRKESININTVIRLVVFKDILMDRLSETAEERERMEIWYGLLLKLIRIYPYAEDTLTISYLDGKTEEIMEIIAGGCR